MPGLVIGGTVEVVPDLDVTSWLEHPGLRLRAGEDCRRRFTRWIRGIVLHTTRGIPGGTDQRPQLIKPGVGPHVEAGERIGRYWSTDGRKAGAHLVVDFDGSVTCLADLKLDAAYHAGEVNEVSIGIEIFQGAAAELYEGQLAAVVRLVNWLTARFGIQRQMPRVAARGVIARIASGAKDLVGVYGHRHVTTNRGIGDPGDAIFEMLAAAGYRQLDFDAHEDLMMWRRRQSEVLELDREYCDGIPSPGVVAMLKLRGYSDGLWIDGAPHNS